MESIKRFFGLVKTPTQLVDRMHFEFRVMDGEETTEKPRKVIVLLVVEFTDPAPLHTNEGLSDWRRG